MTTVAKPQLHYALLASIALHVTITAAFLWRSYRGPLSVEGPIEIEMLDYGGGSEKTEKATGRHERRREVASSPRSLSTPHVEQRTDSSSEGEARAPVSGARTAAQSSAGPTSAGAANAGGSEQVYGEEQVDVAPRLLREPRLHYPPHALRDGLESDVIIVLVVDTEGKVRDAKLSQRVGDGFDEAALEAARSLRFQAGSKSGRPVAVRVQWTCRFRLQS